MTNFLMGKGYWDYIEGDLEEAPEILEENAMVHRLKHLRNGIKGQGKYCIGYHLASQIRCLDTYNMLCFQKKLGTVW